MRCDATANDDDDEECSSFRDGQDLPLRGATAESAMCDMRAGGAHVSRGAGVNEYSALPPPPPLEPTPLSTARGPTRASAQLRAGQPSRTPPAVPYSSSRFDPPSPPPLQLLRYVQDLVRCAGGRRAGLAAAGCETPLFTPDHVPPPASIALACWTSSSCIAQPLTAACESGCECA